MNLKLKQVSSLEKIRPEGIGSLPEITHKTLMRGESFSYQLALESTDKKIFEIQFSSPFEDTTQLYSVKNVVMDFPIYSFNTDEDYLALSPGLMPDMLMPLELENNRICVAGEATALWVRVTVPENTAPGKYSILITLNSVNSPEIIQIVKEMKIEVINATLPEQKILFTQWFHTDCIATAHNVEIYSDEHWELIDKYMHLASELGVNMLLTPVITPPLDTAVGTTRPCTQLVKIEKKGNEYIFDFTLLERWISLCHKNGIKYFEISHMFSQWGLKYAPNIKVSENGKEDYMFGWHTDATSPEYREFLNSFLPALVNFFDEKGLKENCRFHISDEPSLEHLDAYKYAHSVITPLINGCPSFDAISDYDFFETGLIKNPVVATDHIEPFIENKVENLWAYYCCGQYDKVGNRFLSMPSYRNRILGLQLYKYNAVGFLQWGYNFYYSQYSLRKINPYITSSADKAFPSGDSFSVYPIDNGPTPSLRAFVFKDALDDIKICRKLEEYIGRDAVVKMIDDEAGMNITFKQYPRNSTFIPSLVEKIEQMIKSYSK